MTYTSLILIVTEIGIPVREYYFVPLAVCFWEEVCCLLAGNPGLYIKPNIFLHLSSPYKSDELKLSYQAKSDSTLGVGCWETIYFG
jgi:hypothetical protein